MEVALVIGLPIEPSGECSGRSRGVQTRQAESRRVGSDAARNSAQGQSVASVFGILLGEGVGVAVGVGEIVAVAVQAFSKMCFRTRQLLAKRFARLRGMVDLVIDAVTADLNAVGLELGELAPSQGSELRVLVSEPL